MPIHIDPQLIEDLAKRQVTYDTARRTASPRAEGKDLSPSLLAVLGAAADGASTANFLRQGDGTEGNEMFAPLGGSPMKTGLAVAGSGLVGLVASKIIGKKFPKIAKALLANQAATQIGYAGRNVSSERGTSSTESYNNSVIQAIRRTHAQ